MQRKEMSAMSDKEKVLAKWPDAESRYDYASGELQVVVSGLFYKSWADAASHLESAPLHESTRPAIHFNADDAGGPGYVKEVGPPVSDFAAMRMERDALQQKLATAGEVIEQLVAATRELARQYRMRVPALMSGEAQWGCAINANLALQKAEEFRKGIGR